MTFDYYNLLAIGYFLAASGAVGIIIASAVRWPKVVYPLLALLLLAMCSMPVADIWRKHANDNQPGDQ